MKSVVSNDERGLVSLIIVMIIMIIVTLMTISFGLLTRREQRQALDKQLSSQAFYAAETGINDAIKAIDNNPSAVGNISSCATADQDRIKNNIAGQPDRVLDSGLEIATTCVLVDQTPSQIVTTLGLNESKVFRISAAGANHLYLFWQQSPTPGSPTYQPAYSTAAGGFTSNWPATTPGVVEVMLIPGTYANRTDFFNNTREVFAYPSNSNANSSHDIVTDPNGEVLNGNCGNNSAPASVGQIRPCVISITNLNPAGSYYIRMKAIYAPVDVTVVAADATNNMQPFIGAQATIDATGKSGDVVRRIKIYKSFSTNGTIAEYVLEVGDDLCKRLLTNAAETTYENLAPSCSPFY